MAFAIKIQRNLSEPNKVNKTIEDIIEVSGTLKDSTSITNPVILFEGDPSIFIGGNYMYIPTFNRYYFIVDVKTIRNNLFEVTARVDVLMSFKTELAQNTAIINSQENLWNLYLNDGSLRVYQNPKITTKVFPAGFGSTDLVLAVAGG